MPAGGWALVLTGSWRSHQQASTKAERCPLVDGRWCSCKGSWRSRTRVRNSLQARVSEANLSLALTLTDFCCLIPVVKPKESPWWQRVELF